MRTRHLFNPTLWSYAIFHDEPIAIAEFLEHRDDFLRYCGTYIDTTLLHLDPLERRSYEHLEYSPLVNARAHQLGATRSILNDRFRGQYSRLMRVLAYHPELSQDDRLEMSYYLLLQNSVAEGIGMFESVNRAAVQAEVQYDYMQLYVNFYTDDRAQARQLVAQYAEYPVERWRRLFENAAAQLAELEGAEAVVTDTESHTQRQGQLAATHPTLGLEVEKGRVRIAHRNMDEARVNIYPMDIELLFSRSPFVERYAERFSYIRPNYSEVISLTAGKTETTFELPVEYQGRNVLVEVEGAGLRASETLYAHSLDVELVEAYGQVRVKHEKTKQSLSTVYVKVFAKMITGETKFYKDGYTDIRGRFDYASLSTNEMDRVHQFSILVISDTEGAIVLKAAPQQL